MGTILFYKFLLRFVAYCLRYLNNVRKSIKLVDPLSAAELYQAWRRIISLFQEEEFSKEIESFANRKEIPAKSKIKRLCPIMEEGFLRVGGRIKNAGIGFNKRHSIILPKSHPITDLIIKEFHAKLYHARINATLYAIRERYWIIDGKVAVKRILHSCVRIFRVKPKEMSYLMGDLPKVRLTATRPFENTGFVFCGPFFYKGDSKTQ